jgi:WD40 repeat protein
MPDRDEIRYRGRPPASEKEKDPHNGVEQIQRWQWMLEQRVPIIGGWMHRRITTALTESALAGNWLAAQSLAVVHAFHEELEVRRLAGQTLRKINYVTGIDAVWGVWAETRNPGLEQIALEYNRLAGQPASVRLLSALCASLVRPEAITAVTQGGADLVPPLIKALDDGDPRIVEAAHRAITSLKSQGAIDAVCSAWTDSRYAFLDEVIEQAGYVAQKPPAVRVLSALRVGQPDVVTHGTPEMVAPLIKACEHPDAQIREQARLCLLQLQNQPAVDEFCKIWSQSRAPLLEHVLLQAGYHARSPLPVRLLVALKTGRLATAEKVAPEGLPALIDAVRDRDPDISANARKALNHLTNEDTIEALCVRVIDADDAFARQVALENSYAPRTPELRALFYFLTGQWEAYDALDFDQSMLRTIYDASPVKLRQRISTQVQAAARTDYLTILAGVDYRSRAEQVSPDEAALMIRILGENGEYERLWNLAPELALPFSLQIIRLLDDKQWSPADDLDQRAFRELVQLSRQPFMLTADQLARVLPLAISRATLRVRGRANDVAFAPNGPLLAIGASSRKVVLWDFQTAKVQRVLDDFKHSVGKVSFTPSGTLICAERTNDPNAQCAISVYQPEDSYKLTYHLGNITVLETVGSDRLLTAGRDARAVLWDLGERRIVTQKEFDFWPRSAAISADLQYAALMHDKMTLVRLPDLTTVPGYPFLTARVNGYKNGVAQNAAFSPDGKFLLAGQFNGQLGLYFHTSLTQRPRRGYVTQHPGPVRGIGFLPDHPLAISAGGEGQVRFIRWPEMTVQGTVFAPEGQLTSLRLSNSGAFLATGTNDASLTLWDLRVLDIPGLFSQPLATATHDQIANVLALSEYGSLPEPVRNGLKFLRLLLQYRFRFDIQIEEGPIIRYGEFDIVLDDL